MPFFIKLTKLERKKLFVIISCLLIAIFGWIFLSLNNKYIYTAKTVMVFKNLPQNRAFHSLQSDTIDLSVEGTGWQLVFARLRVKPQYVNINLGSLSKQNFIVLSEQVANVNQQLSTAQKVISADPDTLYFDFSKSYEKRIPIRLVSDIKFKKQFSLSQAISLRPKYVTIRGPQEILSKLSEWKSDTLKLENLSTTTTLRIPLKQNELKNINIFPGNVEVQVPVEEFTEKKIEIPLRLYNNNTFYDVNIYPKRVLITFLVALSDYKKVDEDFIEAGVDLNDWKFKQHSRLIVKLKRFPDYCKLVKISPSIVDFTVEK